ncbi:ATP-binding cassette domain-containing protein [Gammaproteobacteria bacterium]|nr:ATP-binding cassette domain-containing protein [Gammaproteobacteria bacterium]
MKEFWSRLMSNPAVAFELITATLFISILALASPIFVMQVLNRYVSQGVDATLITLTSGVLIAIVLELIFRQARLHIAQQISTNKDEDHALNGYKTLVNSKLSALEKVPLDTRREILGGQQAIEQAYNASNISAVLDVPFALLFVFVLYLLVPPIAIVVLAFIIVVFFGGILGASSMNTVTNEVTEASSANSALLGTAIREAETVRAFNAGGNLTSSWGGQISQLQWLRRKLALRQGLVQSLTQSANALMSVAVIVTAGILVVSGELDVGAMIGANILGARALQPISRFSQLGSTFAKARQALNSIEEFSKLPLEKERGSALSNYSGGIEFRDISFNYDKDNNPLYEKLNIKLESGSILIVTGSNGAGKTTLARMIVGLLEPTRGNILVDGLDIQQAASEWWRKQVTYLPQEPALIGGTIGENILVNNPSAGSERLNQIIDAVGLRRFVDESESGVETPILDNGWRLSEGIRRRIALARALITNGKLVVFDEPTESFDAAGVKVVHNILGTLAKAGSTIIIMSHDPKIVQGKHVVLDLDNKPVPTVTSVQSKKPIKNIENDASSKPDQVEAVSDE